MSCGFRPVTVGLIEHLKTLVREGVYAAHERGSRRIPADGHIGMPRLRDRRKCGDYFPPLLVDVIGFTGT